MPFQKLVKNSAYFVGHLSPWTLREGNGICMTDDLEPIPGEAPTKEGGKDRLLCSTSFGEAGQEQVLFPQVQIGACRFLRMSSSR